MTQTGVRSGVLLFVFGLWVVLRTVNQDGSGRTLIDHILGKKGGTVTNAAGTATAGSGTALTPASNALNAAVGSIGAALPSTRSTTRNAPTTARKPNPVSVPAHGGTF